MLFINFKSDLYTTEARTTFGIIHNTYMYIAYIFYIPPQHLYIGILFPIFKL